MDAANSNDGVHRKVVLVTGGASGIGRASALLLAGHGADVVVADRDAAGARAVAVEIARQGLSAMDVDVDVGDSASVARMVAITLARHGHIDVLVHAAGICPRCPVLEMSDDDWRNVLRVNLDGTFFVTREVARAMVERKAGTIILLTSDRGLFGSADYAHYAASKGGQLALARSLALTLGRHGVTVNSINPGLTDTPLGRAANPQWDEKKAIDVMGAVSEPDDIAAMVLFLAGTAGAFMTGQVLGVRLRYGA